MKPDQPTPRRDARRVAFLLCAALLLLLVGSRQPAEADPSRHPLYNDGGTLSWYLDLAEAQRAAAREGKLLLIAVSIPESRACSSVIGMIGDPEVKARMAQLCVGHHINGRISSPLYRTFRANLPPGSYLPWMGFFTPATGWVSGFSPSQRTTLTELRRRFLVALGEAEAHQRRAAAARAPRVSSMRESASARGNEVPRTSSTRVATGTRTSPRPTAPAPRATRTSSSTSLVWYDRISEARAVAQAEGKIILVTSTKPSCGLCKKLHDNVVPQVWREMSKGCVFYVYDILHPESGAVDRIVRRNLPNARLMPLCGFMSPDMRWLQGFYGQTDARKLMSDYNAALRRR
jgi:hypothetical protein